VQKTHTKLQNVSFVYFCVSQVEIFLPGEGAAPATELVLIKNLNWFMTKCGWHALF
jgi:hypothetical protein